MPGQASRLGDLDVEAQPPVAAAERLADLLRKTLSVRAALAGLEPEGDLVQSRWISLQDQLPLVHRNALPQDALHGAGKYVDAADDEHVVHPAEDAALQKLKPPSAGAIAARRTDPIPRPIPNGGKTEAAQVGDDQLALASLPDGLAVGGVQDLDDVLRLKGVNPALFIAGIAEQPDLRHSGELEALRPPGRLDGATQGRNGGPRLARVDGAANRRARDVQPQLPRHFGKAHGVRGGADQDRDLQVEDQPEPFL